MIWLLRHGDAAEGSPDAERPLTDKGRDLRDRLGVMHARHVEMLGQTAITDTDLQGVVVTLSRLERFWMRASDLLQQPGRFAA